MMRPVMRPAVFGGSTRRAVAALVLAAAAGAASPAAAQPRVTFAKDVAPIFFEHCSSCHRPGEIAPFSVLTYRDVRPRAGAIARAVRTRGMPPWKPEPDDDAEFIGARRLTEAQIRTIERWVELGAVEGDPADLPPPPAFTEGWRLGRPDLVVAMPAAYALPAGGSDVLRNFVMPIPDAGTRYVSGIEFRPGNARVVHHANIRIDRSGGSRLADQADPEPGYDGRITTGSFPDGHFLGWTPGQLAPIAPDLAWPLEAGSDLVVQLHMKPGDSPEMVQASVGFFFTDRPAGPTPVMLRLGRQNIDIAPGDARYVIEDRYVLPVDVAVVGVQPHAHYRAREVSGVASLPDGTRKRLIEIKDWDFNWQDAYRYAKPISLPRGTVLSMRYTYDNSAANRRNPDRPPRRVRWGQNSTDEMGDLWIQVVARTNQERDVLRADFGPKVMAEDAAGYEKTLEADPDNFRLHEAVAAIYLLLDNTDSAIPHLRESLRVNPGSVEAHYNLATALVWQRRPDESIEHFRRALQINPKHVPAHVNLGAVLRAQNRLDDAAAHLHRALAIQPDNAVAHTNLAGILAAERRLREAAAHYRLALQSNPDLLESLTDLAWMLATSPDPDIRDPEEAVRLADRAVVLTRRRDVRALETLAAAYAAAGEFRQAVASQQAALGLAEAAGIDTSDLRGRLELYRKGVPYREP
jgi:tetratricopeptide (TPR) repeat protein/mono/diheme cytochrome c family protein